jgi:hypothetical protein
LNADQLQLYNSLDCDFPQGEGVGGWQSAHLKLMEHHHQLVALAGAWNYDIHHLMKIHVAPSNHLPIWTPLINESITKLKTLRHQTDPN